MPPQTQTPNPAQEVKVLSQTGLVLPCGCRIEVHDHSAIMVKYCERHVTFHYSPYHEEGDVFYFVTEDKRP